MGVGPGDEVITPPFTFIATGETICLAGATPVFADIDPRTYNLDPSAAEAKITPRTKVILPVHLFGAIGRHDALRRDCPKNTTSPSSATPRRRLAHCTQGSRSEPGATPNTLSFYPTKNLGACGDGGMVLTDSEELAEQVKLLRFHGSGGKGYFHQEIGYCSRLDGLQAALLRVKARRLPDWNNQRRSNAAFYAETLSGLDGLVLPCTERGNHHIFHQYTSARSQRQARRSAKAPGITRRSVRNLLPAADPFAGSVCVFRIQRRRPA